MLARIMTVTDTECQALPIASLAQCITTSVMSEPHPLSECVMWLQTSSCTLRHTCAGARMRQVH
jgi:hypothetical protein